MAIKFEKIQTGMILYDCHSYRMGNTTLRSLGTWSVKIISVDRERRNAIVSWNGNAYTLWYADKLCKLYVNEPELVRNFFGQMRRKTRAEKKAEKEAKVSS